MGTWGMKAFESDDSMDWVAELEQSSDGSAVRQALTAAAGTSAEECLEAPDGQIAIAAAEVVAAAASGAADDLPEEVRAWLTANGASVAGDVELATRAVARVIATTNSELRDLWSVDDGADPADIAAWESHVADLQRRLAESTAA